MIKTSIAVCCLIAFGLQAYGSNSTATAQAMDEAANIPAPNQTEAETAKDDGAEPSENSGFEMDMPIAGRDLTITESARFDPQSTDSIGEDYNFGKIDEAISGALSDYEKQQERSGRNKTNDRIKAAALSFAVEFIFVWIVLQIALSLSGVSGQLSHAALISLVIISPGALLEYLYAMSLLDPIRIGLSGILMLGLVRLLPDIRKWPKALRITLLARIISLGLTSLTVSSAKTLIGL